MVREFCSRGKVYVNQCVKFIYRNVDIVCTNACRKRRDSFPAVCTRMAYKFTMLTFMFYRFKKIGYQRNSVLITYQKHRISNLCSR